MSGIGNTTTNVQSLRRAIDAAERKALTPLGLTVAGFEMLDILSRDPGISIPWAAARMNVSTQSATTVLARLTEANLVSKSPAMPGRGAAIRLTTAGHRKLLAARVAVDTVDDQLCQALTPEQRDQLDRLLGVGLATFPNERLHQMRQTAAGAAEGKAA